MTDYRDRKQEKGSTIEIHVTLVFRGLLSWSLPSSPLQSPPTNDTVMNPEQTFTAQTSAMPNPLPPLISIPHYKIMKGTPSRSFSKGAEVYHLTPVPFLLQKPGRKVASPIPGQDQHLLGTTIAE